MEVREVGELGEFAALVRDPLRREEPGNALPLGLLGQIEDGRYDDVTLAVVEADGEPVGCVIRTDQWPYNVAAFPGVDAGQVGETVGRWLAARRADTATRLVGPRVVSDPAARSVAAEVGGEAEVVLPLRRMVCEAITWRPQPPGQPGHPGPDDVDLVVTWLQRFHDEATPHAPRRDPDALRQRFAARSDAGPPPLWWWLVDGEPVCLVGIGSPTGSGERIAPVYTPPEHRGRGYAGALVAHVTEDAFARGCRWVGLFTDASNPVSNRLYAKLGFVDIGDAAEWRVDGGAAGG